MNLIDFYNFSLVGERFNKKEGRLLFFWNTTNCALHVLQSQGLKCKPLVTWDKAYLEGKYSASSNNKWDFMQMYKIVQKVSQILSFNCNMKWNIFWGQDQGIWFNFSPFPINNIFLNRNRKNKLLLPVLFIFLFETLFWTKTRLIHFKANLNQMQNWFDILLVEFNQVKTLSFPKTATLSNLQLFRTLAGSKCPFKAN